MQSGVTAWEGKGEGVLKTLKESEGVMKRELLHLVDRKSGQVLVLYRQSLPPISPHLHPHPHV